MYDNPGMYQQGMMTVPVQGQSSYPPQFTQAPAPSFNYGEGQSMPGAFSPTMGATGVAAAVGAVPSALSHVGMGAGMMSMVSRNKVFRGLSFMDPMSAGFEGASMGWGVARGMGMGMAGAGVVGAGAGAGAFAAVYATMEYMKQASKEFMEGAKQQRMLYNTFAHTQPFANAASATGKGFGPGQAQTVATSMRDFAATDPYIHMREANALLSKFNSTDIARGVQDAKEFSNKFRTYAEAVKKMAHELNTSLESASEVFGVMRNSGFYTARDVVGNTRRMMGARSMGMDENTFLSLQQQGASSARGMMMRGRGGAFVAGNMATDLLIGAQSRLSGGTGGFSNEQLMDWTGASTAAEGAASLGAGFADTMGRFLQGTAAGRGLLVNMGSVHDGRFSGHVDSARLSEFASGNASLSDLSRGGAGKMTTGKSRASFVVREHEIASSLMEDERGVEAVMRSMEEEAKKWASKSGVAEDDAIKLFLEHVLHVDKRTADIYELWFKDYQKNKQVRMQRMREQQDLALRQREIAMNYSVKGLTQKAKGFLETNLDFAAEAGGALFAGAQRMKRDLYNAAYGMETATPATSTTNRNLDLVLAGGGTGGFTPYKLDMKAKYMLAGSYGDSSEKRIARSADIYTRARAGEDIDIEELGTTSAMMQSFLATKEGQDAATKAHMAQAARRAGDAHTAKHIMGDLAGGVLSRGLAGDMQMYMTPDQMRTYGVTGGVDGDQSMAAFLFHIGEKDAARRYLRDGKSFSSDRNNIKRLRKRAKDDLNELRPFGKLSGETRDNLLTGGAGSALFADIMATGDLSLITDVFGSGVQDNVADVVAELGKRGIHTTEAEVIAATPALTGYAAQAMDVKDKDYLSARMRRSGQSLQALGVKRVEAGTLNAAHTALRYGSTDAVRGALGTEFTAASEALKKAAQGGGGAGLSDSVNALLSKASSVNIASYAGGAELGDIAGRRKKALHAAHSGNTATALKEIEELYGVNESRIRELAGVDAGATLSAEKLSIAVNELSSRDFIGSAAAGEGGGLFGRGTVEERMSYNLERIADSTTRLAETVEAVDAKVRAPISWVSQLVGHPTGESTPAEH